MASESSKTAIFGYPTCV